MKYLSLVAAFAVVAYASVVSASVQFDLNRPFSPDGVNDTPTGVGPLTGGVGNTLLDIGVYEKGNAAITGYDPYMTANDVILVVRGYLAPNTSVAAITLNFGDTFTDFTQLSVQYLGGLGVSSVLPTHMSVLKDFQVIDGTYGWDMTLRFQGADKFTGNDVAVFKVTFPSISPNQFNVLGNPPLAAPTTFYAAAQIDAEQNLGGTPGFIADADGGGPTTGLVPHVPEPASLAIWGLGSLFGAVAVYRRKRRAS